MIADEDRTYETAAPARKGRGTHALLSVFSVLSVLSVLSTGALSAQGNQDDLEGSRRRLEQIRRERERLQQQQMRLQGQVHDVEDELSNLERQRESTHRIVNEIERQIGGLASQVDRSTAEQILAQDNLSERQAVLERRLVDIYKRGQLYTFQALLAAESFGGLVSRYKYLYLTSRQDKQLVQEVERLRNDVRKHRNSLLQVRGELDRRKEERQAELSRYGQLANERERRIAALRRTAKSTEQKLSQLEKDELKITGLLATLERRRTDAEARSRALGTTLVTGTLTTSDLGRLDWPVEGNIVFQFGPERLPSGATIRWNGIGIGAAEGTPVKAVEGGTIAIIERYSTYGLLVAVEHGNGFYSLYMQLKSANVKKGEKIQRGQVIGTVGGTNSRFGPHLHFEIRGESQIALDPAEWLRRR